MENCENSILELIDEKIELGRSLVDKLERDFIVVDGALKTKRNIDKEIKFLEKVSDWKFSRLSQIFYANFLLHLPAQDKDSRWMRHRRHQSQAPVHKPEFLQSPSQLIVQL